MKKRIITVFIFMLAIVFLTSNVYAGKKKSHKKYKKEIKKIEKKLEKANKKVLRLQEKLAALTGEPAADTPEVCPEATCPEVTCPEVTCPEVTCPEFGPEPTGVIECDYCDFSQSTFLRLDFSGAGLVGADFTGVVLTGSDFTGADLGGAILTNAYLSEEKLDNVIWGYITERYGRILRSPATCPDNTTADQHGNPAEPDNPDYWTCVGHLTPLVP